MFDSPLTRIRQALVRVVGDVAVSKSVTIEHPADPQHGDYATNIALATWQAVGAKNPRQFAEEVRQKLEADSELGKLVSQISVAGPGFINFSLNKKWLADLPGQIVQNAHEFGQNHQLGSQHILIEFTDANPFKEFHIGHLMSNAVGESLARLFESQGAKVSRLCYQGDVGIHIAKALWGWQSALDQQLIDEKSLFDLPLKERVNWLGKFYAAGAAAFTDKPEFEAEIKKLNEAIYLQTDPLVTQRYQTGRQWSLDYLETLYKILGTKFERYYFESQTAAVGMKIVEDGLNKGIFEKSQGAVIFPGEKHGLHTRVFINSQGLPTYEAKELGLAETKRQDFTFDQSIIVTGNEIQDYFQVLLKAMSLMMPEAAQKTRHLSHGMLRLPTGKMSSRTGNVVTGESLLNDITAATLEKVQEAGRVQVAADEQHQVASDIAIAAVKFSILRQSIGRDIIFNPSESISFDGDTGPYLQYTYARAQSVLRKPASGDSSALGSGFAPDDHVLLLLRYLYRFPDVVQRSATDLAPNDICTYLLKVAQLFNTFYGNTKINGNEQEAFLRLVTESVAIILKKGLAILGIKVVEHM